AGCCGDRPPGRCFWCLKLPAPRWLPAVNVGLRYWGNSVFRRNFMPIATPEVYAEMLGRAKENAYAFPAINCTSSETVNAAIKGFADAGSDGIIQFSTGGAEFASGLGVKAM